MSEYKVLETKGNSPGCPPPEDEKPYNHPTVEEVSGEELFPKGTAEIQVRCIKNEIKDTFQGYVKIYQDDSGNVIRVEAINDNVLKHL